MPRPQCVNKIEHESVDWFIWLRMRLRCGLLKRQQQRFLSLKNKKISLSKWLWVSHGNLVLSQIV